jgi:hypothetical protein
LIWKMFTLFSFVPKILDISWIPNWECILRVPWVFPFHSLNVFRPFFCLSLFPTFFCLVLTKVVKTHVTWSFCVEHHVGICSDMLVVFVKINAQKQLFSPKLPSLWLMSENEFQLWQGHFLIVVGLATNFFWLS